MMKFLSKTKIFKYLFYTALTALSFVAIFVFLIKLYFGGENLGYGYELVMNRGDDYHIVRGENTVVSSTVVSLAVLKDRYVVGVRIPAQRLKCEGGKSYKIRVFNRQEYFILSMKVGEVLEFTNQKEFTLKLSELELDPDIKLDYASAERTWRKYSVFYDGVDYDRCEVIG